MIGVRVIYWHPIINDNLKNIFAKFQICFFLPFFAKYFFKCIFLLSSVVVYNFLSNKYKLKIIISFNFHLIKYYVFFDQISRHVKENTS